MFRVPSIMWTDRKLLSLYFGVELDVATVATFNTQNMATLGRLKLADFLICERFL